ncbi:hypothetical protein HY483_02390 [Candidatus Woesearchaeota archaeon]|nr:hypothetical protein [Candidatus Woesearchaeota archaeon]
MSKSIDSLRSREAELSNKVDRLRTVSDTLNESIQLLDSAVNNSSGRVIRVGAWLGFFGGTRMTVDSAKEHLRKMKIDRARVHLEISGLEHELLILRRDIDN